MDALQVVDSMAKGTGQGRQVAVFFPSLAGGGLERVMLTLANGFAARGLAVDLVLVKRGGAYADQVDSRVRVVYLGARSLRTSLFNLVRYLRRERPSLLLSALNGANVAAVLARALSLSPTRVVLTQHNTLRHGARGRNASRRSLSRPLIRWVYRHAEKIITVSRELADEVVNLTGLPHERVVTIYNPVITPELLKLTHEPLDHPLVQPGRPPMILGVGRLVPQKDFPTLLRAFKRVRANRPAQLVILGEGPGRAQLEQLARDLGVAQDVFLPGFVRNPYAWMARSAVFTLSSAWEGLPTVLIEALASGAPVVSTQCPTGPVEILQGGRLGELVPVGDDAALAEAIDRVLNGGRRPVAPSDLEPFTLEASLDRYVQVLGLAAPAHRAG